MISRSLVKSATKQEKIIFVVIQFIHVTFEQDLYRFHKAYYAYA